MNSSFYNNLLSLGLVVQVVFLIMKLMGYVDWDWLFVMYPLAICIGSQILGLFVTIIYAFVIKLLIKKELTRFESLNSKYDIEELIKKYSGKTNE